MMRLRKIKNNFSDNGKTNDDRDEKNQAKSLKQEMIDTLLQKKDHCDKISDEESQNHQKEIEILGKEFDNISKSDDKISLLMKKIEQLPEMTAVPRIDLTSGRISYPILSEIDENEENIELLEKLSKPPFDLIEKIPYERFVVCPKHSGSFAINVRLYCSKCNSMDIEKIHLLEHNKCGYIAERKKYIVSADNMTICPSCNKKIEDESKELHVPAMWYVCNECNQKFDDVSIKLYCREFNHDFSPNQSQTLQVPAFKFKNDESDEVIDTSEVFEKLNKILSSQGFTVEEKVSIKGKSGRYHTVDLFAKNKSDHSISIFIKKSNSEIDNSEINSKIIQVLDTEPNIAILIGFASISDKAKAIAASYNVSVISSQDTGEIVESVDKLLSKELVKFKENAPQS